MNDKIKVALLIPTYNQSDILNLILKAVCNQSLLPYEVLIAEDQINDENKKVIDAYRNKLNVIHCNQEDTGFYKSKILNKAIAESSADYIIQIDGDCIPHKNLVEDYSKFIQKGVYLYGTRVKIKQKYVKDVLAKKQINFSFFDKKIYKRFRNIRCFFLARQSRIQLEINTKLRGANCSFWREDAIKINGYNEDIKGWGREDTEFFARMQHIGIKNRRIKFAAIVYHLDHAENDKTNLNINHKVESQAKQGLNIIIKNGIDKYLS
ncbi:MAG: glycosyltransferase [Flavobacteriales bacterium]|nr:glycosyltransferase [Flavobacteriales bacterium]